jgi:hypothetical protein
LKGLPFAVGAITLTLVGLGSMGQAQAADAASLLGGNLGAQDKANGPIVSIISPNYNDLLAGEVQVLVGVQARKHTPQSIELYVDGKLHSDPRMPLSAFPANQFTWKTARFSDGPHNLRVVITDTQGFRGSAEVTVFINNNRVKDLTPPALEWINVRQGDVWRGLVDLHLKAVDNFGVKFLIISLKPVQPTGQKPDSWSWLLNRPAVQHQGLGLAPPAGRYVFAARHRLRRARKRRAGRPAVDHHRQPLHQPHLEAARRAPQQFQPGQPHRLGCSAKARSAGFHFGNCGRGRRRCERCDGARQHFDSQCGGGRERAPICFCEAHAAGSARGGDQVTRGRTPRFERATSRDWRRRGRFARVP